LEAHLKTKYNEADIKLISSGGGVFEITLDNELIFSKKALGRFPDDGEIDNLIDQAIA
jgi:selenoprotein W-related protein